MLFTGDMAADWLGMSQAALRAAIRRNEIDAIICDGRDGEIIFITDGGLYSALVEYQPLNLHWFEAFLSRYDNLT